MIDKDIIGYVSITLVLGYILQIITTTIDQDNIIRIYMVVLVAFIPGLIAIIYNLLQPEVPFMENFSSWSVPIKYYLLAIIIPMGFGIPLHFLIDKNSPLNLVNLVLLPLIFVITYLEELGWRGYLQRILVDYYNQHTVALFIGLVWAFYHLPGYLSDFSFLSLLLFLDLIIISIGLSMIFIYILLETSSIPVVVVFHSMNILVFALFTTSTTTAEFFTIELFVIRLLYGFLLVITGLFLLRYTEEAEFDE